MAILTQKGNRTRYWVMDRGCLGRDCLALGRYQHRGATSSGSRSTGASSPMCMTNAYRGCPQPLPEIDKGLAAENRRAGMKVRE